MFVAERGGQFLAAVRRTVEHGLVLLRGMHVAPQHQRTGIGSQLLRMFVEHLDGAGCYCLPYQHLRTFYACGGFAAVSDAAAPDFLRARVSSYRTRGLDVLVMHRPTAADVLPRERPNQAMQRTASKAATDILRVCHPPVDCVARFTGLAVADLVSR